ncbi:MAG: hypothetical protein ACAI44_08840 [Candidatus Sericytochromatia bacterium]
MIQAEKFIDLDMMANWVQSWDDRQYMDYFETQIQDRLKRLKVRSSMEENIVKIKKLCLDMGETLHFHSFLQLMNRIVFNCYFKQGNSALRIANFYEEILVPADQTTRNRMFGYRNGENAIGRLQVKLHGEEVGQFGEQSDMFHLIFDACFHTEDELFEEADALLEDSLSDPRASAGDDALLTLKIWKPGLLKQEPDRFVDQFLFHCSTKLNLNFKRASYDIPLDHRSEPIETAIEVRPIKAEKLPLLYFNSASHNLPPQIVYMSYYHAISYFFERAVHLIIRDKMKSMFDVEEIDEVQQLRRIAKAINTLRDRFSEKEALELVLKRVLWLEPVNAWLDAAPERRNLFTRTQEKHKELPLLKLNAEKEILRSLVERVYALKSTIEEARDKRDNFIWIHSLDEELLQNDIPLIKLLAALMIENWSLAPES